MTKGSDLRNFLTHGDDDKREEVLNELIDNNREEHTDPHYRKSLNDFYRHNIENFSTFSKNTQNRMKGAMMRLQEETIQGSQLMLNFTHNYDIYKPNIENIKQYVKNFPKRGDLAKVLDNILNKYTADVYE